MPLLQLGRPVSPPKPPSPSAIMGGGAYNDIHFIGDIFCDLLAKNIKKIPEFGEDTPASISIMPGGSCLNSICHCAEYCEKFKLQIRKAIFASVADDHQAKVCMDRLLQVGVSTENLFIQKDNRTGTCIVISGPDDRGFITDSGCNSNISKDYFDQEKLFRCGHMHVSGFYNVSPLKDETAELFRQAKERGITTSLNCQYDVTGRWGIIPDICPHLDFLIGNTNEIEGISRSKDQYEWAKRILYDLGCNIFIVTKGIEGVSLFMKPDTDFDETSSGNTSPPSHDSHMQSSIKSGIKYMQGDYPFLEIYRSAYNVESEFKDCTGAGDAFVGGFLSKWISLGKSYERKRLQQALEAGCVCGATAVTCFGGCFTDQDGMERIFNRIHPDRKLAAEIQENVSSTERRLSFDSLGDGFDVSSGGGGGGWGDSKGAPAAAISHIELSSSCSLSSSSSS